MNNLSLAVICSTKLSPLLAGSTLASFSEISEKNDVINQPLELAIDCLSDNAITSPKAALSDPEPLLATHWGQSPNIDISFTSKGSRQAQQTADCDRKTA